LEGGGLAGEEARYGVAVWGLELEGGGFIGARLAVWKWLYFG
jgi:hypothetical protein